MKHQVLVCDDELAQAQSLAEMLERAIVIQDDERQGKLEFLGYYTHMLRRYKQSSTIK